MASETKKCRVCGKEYEACRTAKVVGVFRWQEVACSPECGTIYLQKINESRGLVEKEPVKKSKRKKFDEVETVLETTPAIFVAETVNEEVQIETE